MDIVSLRESSNDLRIGSFMQVKLRLGLGFGVLLVLLLILAGLLLGNYQQVDGQAPHPESAPKEDKSAPAQNKETPIPSPPSAQRWTATSLVLVLMAIVTTVFLALACRRRLRDLRHSLTTIQALHENLQQRETEERQAEVSLTLLNNELEHTVQRLHRSNAELRNLAHAAAHDLKTPLRAVGTLTDWLLSETDGSLNSTATDYVQLIRSRVRTMDRYVDAVQQYTAIGARPKDIHDVDLNVTLSALRQNMSIPEGITLRCLRSLPTLVVSASRIRLVFKHLLDNAIRFMDKEEGRIDIHCRERENEWEFAVTDNGPGINSRHQEQIFQMFRTLDSKDVSETIGMGLPIARKIIERHGGTLWLESEPGKGSTFFFTLPKEAVGLEVVKDEG